jgi:hypothetical protein
MFGTAAAKSAAVPFSKGEFGRGIPLPPIDIGAYVRTLIVEPIDDPVPAPVETKAEVEA